jgi:hypothetical protein
MVVCQIGDPVIGETAMGGGEIDPRLPFCFADLVAD